MEGIADLFWIAFNVYFIYLSFNFVFFKMNLFWKSQTLGVPMKYIYLILPLAFTLMTIRILQVNYLKLVKGIDVRDPEKVGGREDDPRRPGKAVRLRGRAVEQPGQYWGFEGSRGH